MKMNIALKVCKAIIKVVGKKRQSLHEPFFGRKEIHYLKKSIKNNSVSTYGKETNKFENIIKNFTGAKYVHAIINGSAAIHLSLYLAGIDENSEVLIPGLNYIASTNATIQLKGTPHFIDVEEETLGPSTEKLENYLKKITIIKNNKCINRNTKKIIKAIVVTHIFGHPCKLDKIMKICKKYKIKLIEDAAEGLGSYFRKRHVGTFGTMGIISFNGNKIITTGGGGVILTNSKKLSKKIKLISQNSRIPHKWKYEYAQLGFNYRMPSINAQLGIAQMKNINKFLSSKRKLYQKYYLIFKKFKDLRIMREPINTKSNYWLQTIILNKPNNNIKNEILKITNSINIGTRPVWNVLNHNKYLKSYPNMSLNKSNELAKRIINLPSGVALCQKK